MRLFSLIFLCLWATTATAQVPDSYYFSAQTTYDKAIPTPQQFLGYQIGQQHVTPYETYAYMRELDRRSDRITLEVYGHTYGQKELLLLTITSPQNHQKLPQLKAEHQQLMDGAASGRLNTAAMPAVVWMGYSVHGNEPSGTNASLLAAYHLAAAQGKEIDDLLSNTIILLDPCINPDGGNRFATWVNQHRSQTLVSDVNDREFAEVWPGGRSNHYWFDLNRDWLYQQLPESRGRLVKFYEWKPNILTDHHEMGSNSSFFFQPGMPSRTNPNTPKRNIELTTKIGNYHAAALDAIGSAYYTQENYDDFYYGKGSTLPDINGAVGILFEQASSRGHLRQTPNGPLSFPFTIRNQFATTLSTLKAAQEMRVELLNHMRDFYQEKPTYAAKAYVFGGGNDPVRTWEMVNMMQRNQIEVHELSRDERLGNQEFKKENSFVVSLNQPQHRLINSLFERRTAFQDSAFYDISAWTIPLCMNVPYAEATTAIGLGKKLAENAFPKGRVVGDGSAAFLMPWDSYFAPRTAYELMKKGYRLKAARQPFTAKTAEGDRSFSYGTIQFSVKDTDREWLKTLAARDGVTFYGLGTGLTPEGIDLGSEQFYNLTQPKPLLAVGDGVTSLDAGEIWHLLDTRYAMPLTKVEVNRLNATNLSSYTHLILPDGRYGSLSAEKVREFVQNGGTLVALGDAAAWAAANKLGSVKVKTEAKAADEGRKLPYAQAATYAGAMETAGTIFEATVDVTHPIAYGYVQDKMPLFKANNISFEDTGNPYDTPLVYTKNPLMAGYVHPKNLANIKGSPAVIAQNIGRGRVILFSDNPNFRAFWYGTNKLFANALFFSPLIGSGRYSGGEE